MKLSFYNDFRLRICILALVISIVPVFSLSASEISDINLTGHWDFTYTAEFPIQPSMPLAEEFTCKITVPGYWDDQRDNFKDAPWWKEAKFNPDYRPIEKTMSEGKDAELPYLMGVGWYRKNFEATDDWQGKSIVLYIGGLVRHCHIYLNGQYIGYYFGDFTPFEFDLSKHVAFGQSNELVLAVTNRDREGFSTGRRGYHSYSAGISGAVRIHVSDGPGRIQSIFLRPINARKDVRWWVELDTPYGTKGQTSELVWRILDLDGRELRRGVAPVRAMDTAEIYRAEWDMPREELGLWSTWDPQLYRVEVTWQNTQGETWDRKQQRFGLRELEVRGTDMFLNGRPIMFRGGHDSYYFAPYIHPPTPMTVAYFKPRLEALKNLGYNALRFHTWTPYPEYMEAADEVGILLEVERATFMNKNRNPDPRIWAQRENDDTWKDMVYWCRQYPSVAIYCGGNESFLSEQKISFWEKCYQTAKQLDPGCLVMPMQGMRNIEYVKGTPPQHAKNPQGYYDRLLERITKSTDVFGQYAWGHLSYTPIISPVSAKELVDKLKNFHRPILTHESGLSACYLDLILEKRYNKNIPPDFYRVARERLEAAGRADMAQRYYENSCRWQTLCMKYNFEKIRQCPVIDGFDHLGAWDIHWHRSGYACGWMNEFLELKYGRTAEYIREFNDDSVVLLDAGCTRNVRPDEAFSREVMVSLYGGKPLENGILTWTLTQTNTPAGPGPGKQTGSPLLTGKMTNLTAQDGKLNSLGNLEFVWPKVDNACKVVLRLTLTGDGYDMTNHWDYWIFPEKPAPTFRAVCENSLHVKLSKRYTGLLPPDTTEKTTLWITDSLRPDHLEHLAGGGDLLLLGSKPFPTRKTSFQIGNAGRPNHNVATVIHDHPIWDGFPHEGFCDWQFYPMFTDGTCLGTIFNDLQIPFTPILEVVSSYKDVKLQAGIWEAQIEDGGRLFVNGCGLDMDDPGSVDLLDRILGHVSSPQFRPAVTISMDHLAEMASMKRQDETTSETDKADDAALKPDAIK